MQYDDLKFLLRFLPAFLLLYYAGGARWKKYILIAGSILFFSFSGLRFLPKILSLLAVNFLLLRLMKKKSRVLLVLCVGVNLLALLYSKLSGEFIPGISFLVFTLIALALDRYRNEISGLTLTDYAVYTTMFPKLISGPITRYRELEAELKGPAVTFADMEKGLGIFLLGLGYKVLLSNQLAGLWREIQMIGYDSISTQLSWMGVFGYSLQLYFDFQGYSLMATGLGKMLGFTLPENFRSPYCAKSVSDFYRRWHCTLGSWFRDYVYIPLGGSRKGMAKTIVNLFLVWLLTSLWHGFGGHFLLWGMSLFGLIVLEKLFLKKWLAKSHVLSHLYVLTVIPVTWMFFAVEKLSDILIYLERMFPWFSEGGINVNGTDYIKYGKMYGLFLALGVLFALPWPGRLLEKYHGKLMPAIILLGVFWLCIYELVRGMNNPFLYFQF